MKLYHYTSFESFVRIWFTKTLLFSSPNNVNDILERTRGVKTNNPFQYDKLEPFSKLLESYKQVSLTRDYSDKIKGCMSPMMWGQYGCKGQGVCIELEKERIESQDDVWDGPIDYTDYLHYISLPANSNSEEALVEYVCENKNDILFKKHTSWEKENEYRFISRTRQKLNIADAITAVFVQNGRSNDNHILYGLVNEAVPVNVIQYEETNGVLVPKVYHWKDFQRMFENHIREPEELNRILATFGMGEKA